MIPTRPSGAYGAAHALSLSTRGRFGYRPARRRASIRLSFGDEERPGTLGLGDAEDRGDGPGEMGDALPAVDLGAGKVAVAVATSPGLEGDASISTCALLSDGSVKCWGSNALGELGLGDALPAVKLFSELW